MARLPVVGSDDGTWGTVLNDYLSVAHNTDGSLKSSALSGYEQTANKGQASGYAPLDASSHVPLSNLPLPLAQSNTHASVDTDSAPTALHHTLGTGANQAAAGNHIHTLVSTLPTFTKFGTLSVSAGTLRLPIDASYTITGVRLTVGTAPTGANLIIDVLKNGTTIFTTSANRPTITAGSNSGGPGSAPDVPSIAAGDYLTVNIDQVGSTVAGADLVASIIVSQTVT